MSTTTHSTPRAAVTGELTPAALALLLELTLFAQKDALSKVSYSKRTFGEHHETVGVAMAELSKVNAALAEIVDFGAPRASVAA